jgi:anti-sigma factor RsiW
MMKDRCLSDDEITSYVDGVVEASMRKRIEAHLSKCALCLHNVAELKQLIDSQHASPTMPTDAALAKAESLIARRTQSPRQFDITVVLRDGICRILESTGNLLLPRQPSTVPVRGKKRGALGPRIAKSLAGYLVTVELTPGEDTVRPKLTLVEEASSTKPDGVKARLYSPGACETKYSHRGQVIFPALGQGFFRIEIEEIGTIGLDIK